MIRVVFSFLLFLSFALPAFALDVNEVRVGQHGEATRFVLEVNEKPHFRAFVLNNPPRLVMDLPEFIWKADEIQTKSGSMIKEIRHGHLMEGVSRIVLDMDQLVAIDKAFVLLNPHRLVVDYKRSKWVQKQTFGAFDPNKVSDVAITATPKPNTKPQSEEQSIDYKPLVVIDPGHGGVDPGAIGANGLHEKNVVLKLAKNLRNQLKKTGRYRVKMTRDSDKFIRLHHRVKFAREAGADLFISVHADSVNKPHVQGASVYTLSEKASDAQTARLAARENQADLIAGIDLSVEDDEVADILLDLAMRDTMNQSKYFANQLTQTLKHGGVKTLPRPHRSAGFAVLKAPDVPSVLVEAGFMSNRKEAGRLNTLEYRTKVARSLLKGIDAYFAQVRKNERL